MSEQAAVRTREKWVDDVKGHCLHTGRTGTFLSEYDEGEYSAGE